MAARLYHRVRFDSMGICSYLSAACILFAEAACAGAVQKHQVEDTGPPTANNQVATRALPGDADISKGCLSCTRTFQRSSATRTQ